MSESEAVTINATVAALQAAFPDRIADEGADSLDSPIVRIGADHLLETMRWLRDEPSLRFDFLSSVTAIDWTERQPRFDLVYHLYSVPHRLRLTVKAGTDEAVPSLVSVWPAADWLERETLDLYGIRFEGHPDPRRIFMPDDWDGYPLRKDYPLEGPNLDLLTRQQAAFRGGRFDRIRGEYEMNEQERQMAGPGIVGALWTPKPPGEESPGEEPPAEE